eukprot:scaffold35866_cov124-Isochrysis_galbana.AAC.2
MKTYLYCRTPPPAASTMSGVKPKASVRTAVSSRPDVMAHRIPSRLMICGAMTDVSAMPAG